MRRFFGTVFLLLVLGGIAGGFLLERAMRAPGPLPIPTNYVVPREALAPLAQDLAGANIVADPLVFRLAALITRLDGRLHAAEFAFPAQASVLDVLRILRTAKPVMHKLTIPEGLTAQEITNLLNGAEAAAGSVPSFGEAYVFPDTYEFVRGTTRAALVGIAHARMQKILDQEWQSRVAGLPVTTPDQALILASIVERETALPAERPQIAAVFLNRLRLGMKLQSDPTVVYGASNGMGKLDRPISRADLAGVTAYNTYVIDGLPPTAIASPGRAAIDAVLHPAQSEALYFVANGSGGHSFAATLEEHQQNVEKWRKLGH